MLIEYWGDKVVYIFNLEYVYVHVKRYTSTYFHEASAFFHLVYFCFIYISRERKCFSSIVCVTVYLISVLPPKNVSDANQSRNEFLCVEKRETGRKEETTQKDETFH